MFSALHKRMHLSPATAIATLALVLAMTGGAYAASKYVITSTKQISPKVLKSLKGASGAKGANGANGTNGAPGATGPAGATGATGSGTPGAEGPQGKPGESVTNAKLNAGNATCKEGGAEFKVGSGAATHACNGSPWTAGGTLPEGATETGAWAFGKLTARNNDFIPVASFSIRLRAPLDSAHVHYINQKDMEEPEAGVEVQSKACSGNLEEPTATSGNLCIYAANLKVAGADGSASIFPPGGIEESGAGVTGAFLLVALGEEEAEGRGTWAVTG